MVTGAAQQQKRSDKRDSSNRPLLHVVKADTAAQIRGAQPHNRVRERHYHKEIARRRRLIAAVGALVLVFFSVNLYSSAAKLYAAHLQLTQVNQQLAETKTENGKLKGTLKNLKQSDYLAQVLRNKYQYSKSGEIIFNFPSASHKK